MTARRLKANSYLCDDRISYTRIHPQWPFQVARQRPKVHVRIQLGAATILMWLKIRVGLAQRTRLEVSQSDRKSRIQRLIVAVKLDNDWHCGAGARSHVTIRRTPNGDVPKHVLEPNKAMQQIITDLRIP